MIEIPPKNGHVVFDFDHWGPGAVRVFYSFSQIFERRAV